MAKQVTTNNSIQCIDHKRICIKTPKIISITEQNKKCSIVPLRPSNKHYASTIMTRVSVIVPHKEHNVLPSELVKKGRLQVLPKGAGELREVSR